MASDSYDVGRHTPQRGCRRRVARHKDQKSFRTVANTGSQTPEKESDTHSIARNFAKTKESFADSLSEPDAERQIKAEESISDARTNGISGCDRDAISESSRKADALASGASCARQEGLAKRESFA
jgi:hypothetical protein